MHFVLNFKFIPKMFISSVTNLYFKNQSYLHVVAYWKSKRVSWSVRFQQTAVDDHK